MTALLFFSPHLDSQWDMKPIITFYWPYLFDENPSTVTENQFHKFSFNSFNQVQENSHYFKCYSQLRIRSN